MLNHGPEDELLAAALTGPNDCPSLEDLERLLNEGAPAPLARHVDGCSRCQTELQMLRSFTSDEVRENERAAVDSIVARLKASSSAVAPRWNAAADERPAWWKQILAVRWLTPAAAMLAVALAVVGVAIEVRQGRQPSLDTSSRPEVLRSSTMAILGPRGDLHDRPAEIRWEAAPNATHYRVRLMEVDRTELWSVETTSPRADLPPGVVTLIVPAKTLLIQVAAFDANGNKIAESETARFRLLQNVYTQ